MIKTCDMQVLMGNVVKGITMTLHECELITNLCILFYSNDLCTKKSALYILYKCYMYRIITFYFLNLSETIDASLSKSFMNIHSHCQITSNLT